MWKLPVYLVKFWYLEAPLRLLKFFNNLNKSFFNAFSLPLMLKTFFKPWKNEYRKGLVRFSVFMGITIKSLFILADMFLFVFLLLAEVVVFVLFLAWPLLAFYLPFIKI